jgi:hypothetical protein
MAFKLVREKTCQTPYVLVDEEKRYMRLEGESYQENVVAFFKEIVEWLDGFLQTDFDAFTFDCELKYFNSSTVKMLMNMLDDMDSSKNGKNITVNWITVPQNKVVIESGEDLREDLVNLTFNFVTKEPGPNEGLN